MSMYPVCIDIKDRKCVVVGGGRVAYRKTVSLCRCGALVEVVSPVISEWFHALAKEHNIVLREKNYSESDITGAILVFACTNSSEVNRSVSLDARKHNILVNCTEDSAYSSFMSSSSFQRGDLSISVSTNGQFPALSKRIVEQLKESYGEEYAGIVEQLSQFRQKVLEEVKAEHRKYLLKQAVEQEALQIAINEGLEAYGQYLEKSMERYYHEQKTDCRFTGE